MVKRACVCQVKRTWVSPAVTIGLGCILLAGCTGFSPSTVGEPTWETRAQFQRNLSLLRAGMPADSLALLFAEAKAPGEAGILHQARIVTTELERVTYTLGWKSDPRHQIGVKDMSEIDVAKATVIAENSRVISVELHD